MRDLPFDQTVHETARQAERDPHLPPRRAAVVVVSAGAAAGTSSDTAGPAAVRRLREAGLECPGAVVVADGPSLRAELLRQLQELPGSERADLLVTCGGVGLGAGQRAPEVTAELLDVRLPGLMHAVRAAGLRQTPAAALWRGCAGTAGRTLVVNLPGARGGVRDGLETVLPLLEPVLDQLEEDGAADPGRAERPPEEPGPREEPSSREPSGAGTAEDASEDAEPSVVVDTWVTDQPLDPAGVRALAATPAAGAMACFSGPVRDRDDDGRAVAAAVATAHPTAATVLRRVCEEIAEQQPGVRIAAAHRTGSLRVGESVVEIAVAAEHRPVAFAVCAELADQIADRVPIWIELRREDGTAQWAGA